MFAKLKNITFAQFDKNGQRRLTSTFVFQPDSPLTPVTSATSAAQPVEDIKNDTATRILSKVCTTCPSLHPKLHLDYRRQRVNLSLETQQG